MKLSVKGLGRGMGARNELRALLKRLGVWRRVQKREPKKGVAYMATRGLVVEGGASLPWRLLCTSV